MNPFLQLCISLWILPQFNTLLFSCKKAKFAVKKYLSWMTSLACTSLCINDFTLTPRKNANLYTRVLKLKIHWTYYLHLWRLIETPQSHSISSTDIKWTRFKYSKKCSWLLKTDLNIARLGRFCWGHCKVLRKVCLCSRLPIHDSGRLICNQGFRQRGSSRNIGALNFDSTLPIPKSDTTRRLWYFTIGHLGVVNFNIAIEINTYQILTIWCES